MFVALNKEDIKVDVRYADKNEEHFCPVCKGKLRIKDGSINAKHFAHVSLRDCDDFSTDMSEWHREWQEQFPLKNREVVIEHGGEKHRGDVLAYGHVIEFQHSPISCEEFNRRNDFYTAAGKRVIWIFDVISEVDAGKMSCYDEWSHKNDNGGKWEWKYSKKCFRNFVPNKQEDVILFFQTAKTDFSNEEDECYLERVTWARRDSFSDETSFSRFCTSYDPGTKTELLNYIKCRYEKNPTNRSALRSRSNKPLVRRATNNDMVVTKIDRLSQDQLKIYYSYYNEHLNHRAETFVTIDSSAIKISGDLLPQIGDGIEFDFTSGFSRKVSSFRVYKRT